MLRYIFSAVGLIGLLGLAACNAQSPRVDTRAPTDTGNMAYPAPLPAGNVMTTRP